jgi:hypothetical protein
MKKILTKDFLEPMPLEEIKDIVKKCKKGTFHSIMILDGAPISLDDGNTLYVTETFPCTFNISYGNMPHMKFKRSIEKAATPEKVAEAREMYSKLKHPEFVSKGALNLLESKEKAVAMGTPLKVIEEEKPKEILKDTDCSAITYHKNGSVTLLFYHSDRNSIRSVPGGFEFHEADVEIRYFMKLKSGSVIEVCASIDEELEKTLKKARTMARTVASKPSGAPSPVKKVGVQNVLHIW